MVQSDSPFLSDPSSPSLPSTSTSCRFMSILTLSRDRTLQICRSLTFPELDLDHEDILDLYLSLPESNYSPYFGQSSNSKNHAFFEQPPDSTANSSSSSSPLTAFLLREMQRHSLLELLKELRELPVRPSRNLTMRLKYIRNCLRPPEITLWFALQLVLRVVEGKWRKKKRNSQDAEAGDANDDDFDDLNSDLDVEEQIGFDVLLARSLLWAGAAPLNELLPDDVHFLIRKRNEKMEGVRRLCSQCSTKKAGGNKRSSFFCPCCGKYFCRSGKCFQEYHRQHYYRNYPFLT